MGEVCRASDPELGRDVAVVVLRPELAVARRRRALAWGCGLAAHALAALVLPCAVSGQGTALVSGTVVDTRGQPLAGVAVELRSPADVRGNLTTTANRYGYYRMAGLAPGVWELTFRQTGFATLVRSGLVLSVGTELKLDVRMQVGATDEVTVVAEAPVVETTKSSVGEVVPQEFVEKLPILDGVVFDLLPVVAGVHRNPSTGHFTGLGETQRALNVIIDGSDNNDDQAQFGQLLVDQYFHETIQEIEVVTSGYDAEYGGAAGAVARIVTRSGSDELHGRVLYFHRDDALASSPIEGQEPAPVDRNDYGFTLGGPLVRERLWLLGAARVVDAEEGTEFDPAQLPEALRTNFFGEPEDFEHTKSQVDEKVFFLKTTAALGKSHRLNVSAMHFPNSSTNRSGFSGDVEPIGGRVLPSAGVTLNRPGQQYKANLLLAPGSSTVVETHLGFSRTTLDVVPNEARPPIEVFPDFRAGNSGQTPEAVDFRKLQWSTDVTHHVDDWGGSHRFKAGVRLIRDWMRTVVFEWGEGVLYATNDRSTPVFTVEPRSLDPRGFGWDVALTSKAFFVQDSWRPSRTVTLNIGYRFDVTAPFDHVNHSPRAGVAWDVRGDGKTVLRAHYGRFYDGSTGTLLLFAPELGGRLGAEFVFWEGLAPQLGGVGQPLAGPPPQITDVDRDFRTAYTDAFVAGVEREIADGWSASAEYVHRNSEDGIGRRLVNWDPRTRTTTDAGPQRLSIANWNHGRFRSLQLTLRKRFGDRFQLLTSYTWSDWSTNGLNDIFGIPEDPGRPEVLFPGGDSVPHALKLSGFYALPAGIRVSAILQAQSGLPYSAAATGDRDGDGFADLPPEAPLRNAFRRAGYFSLDARLSKVFRVGPGQIELSVDGFNVTNHQNVRDVFRQFGSDDFGEAQSFYPGRTLQLGARYSF